MFDIISVELVCHPALFVAQVSNKWFTYGMHNVCASPALTPRI